MTVSEYINDTFQALVDYGCYFRLVNVAKLQIHSLDLSRSEAGLQFCAGQPSSIRMASICPVVHMKFFY